MSKVKISLKLQGLELAVEAERADIPAITHGIQKQLSGIIQAPAMVISSDPLPEAPTAEKPSIQDAGFRTPRTKRKNRDGGSTGQAIDFKHDPVQWGVPNQNWSNKEKTLWLMHIVAEQTTHKELTYEQIIQTFNKHFRQAKALNRGNTNRDLGTAKLASLVGEDTTKSPATWYLLDEGKKLVQKLRTEQAEVGSSN